MKDAGIESTTTQAPSWASRSTGAGIGGFSDLSGYEAKTALPPAMPGIDSGTTMPIAAQPVPWSQVPPQALAAQPATLPEPVLSDAATEAPALQKWNANPYEYAEAPTIPIRRGALDYPEPGPEAKGESTGPGVDQLLTEMHGRKRSATNPNQSVSQQKREVAFQRRGLPPLDEVVANQPMASQPTQNPPVLVTKDKPTVDNTADFLDLAGRMNSTPVVGMGAPVKAKAPELAQPKNVSPGQSVTTSAPTPNDNSVPPQASTSTDIPDVVPASLPKAMSSSPIAFIKQHEGFRARAYKDNTQFSVGYGTRARFANEVITKEQAEQRLNAEVQPRVAKLQRAAQQKGIILAPNQVSSMVSFDYNTGKGVQLISKAKSADDLPFMMMRYNKSAGKVLPGLVKRRQAEVQLFNTPSEETTI